MLRTWIVLISESYKKKATPRAEETDNTWYFRVWSVREGESNFGKIFYFISLPNVGICVLSKLFENYIKSTKYSKSQNFFWLNYVLTVPGPVQILHHSATTDACYKDISL